MDRTAENVENLMCCDGLNQQTKIQELRWCRYGMRPFGNEEDNIFFFNNTLEYLLIQNSSKHAHLS